MNIAATMFGDPLGHQMMFGGVALQVIGTLIIRKIVNVEYRGEPPWT